MHLICLGVVKKLLLLITALAPYNLRISRRKESDSSPWERINLLINTCRLCLPREFSRKCRPLEEIKRWKATEFRLFLLYVGPIVLKGNIRADQYNNFLGLSIAIFILANKEMVT